MSVYLEGNAFIDGGQVQNVFVTSSSIGNCTITTSSIDMNLANITNVKDPINAQDAATKNYIDALGIVITSVPLSGTTPSQISSSQRGSFRVLIDNQIVNGPTGIFDVTKNEASLHGHVIRIAATPGNSTNVTLRVSWPPNSGIQLYKTGTGYDGSYRIKII